MPNVVMEPLLSFNYCMTQGSKMAANNHIKYRYNWKFGIVKHIFMSLFSQKAETINYGVLRSTNAMSG